MDSKSGNRLSSMIYILGAGNMARETLNIYRDLNKLTKVAGFIEEKQRNGDLKIYGKSVMDATVIDTLPKSSTFIGAIGSPKRKRWIEEIERRGFGFETAIHPSVIRGEPVKIHEGSIICAAVVLTCDIEIGRHTIVNINSTVSHDCVIGDFVTICPGVSIGGNVKIDNETWVGIGATIINKVSIGRGAYICAGAVVTEDIPESVLAAGVPAKPLRTLVESDWRKLV